MTLNAGSFSLYFASGGLEKAEGRWPLNIGDHISRFGCMSLAGSWHRIIKKIYLFQVNMTNNDWPLKATITGLGFHGPQTLLAKAYQTSKYPLLFRPQNENPVAVSRALVISKVSSLRQQIYVLFSHHVMSEMSFISFVLCLNSN